MRREFKIAFVILLVATVVWSLACYLHVQAYNRYVQERIERYTSLGFDIEFVLGYIHPFKPFWFWGLSLPLFFVGLFLIMAWIGFCAELRRMRK